MAGDNRNAPKAGDIRTLPEARDIRIVTEADLRAALPLDIALVDVIERAFAALADNRTILPPILSMDLAQANGEVDVKTAWLPGFDSFAIKVSPGFFDNPALGLPSLNGLMVLFSARTGLVEALYLDNGYLTDLRTAAAGAVAARHLAPGTVEVAGLMGTGVQARLQMRAAHLVRPFRQLLVWGRDGDKARTCAADLARDLGVETRAVDDPRALVAASQLVVTTTSARAPILRADWLHPGLHVTAMGSDQAGKNEIVPASLPVADLYVADRESQTRTLGELRAACAAGIWGDRPVTELGAIVTGAAAGRQNDDDVTICDLTGTGAQDTAIANHVFATLPDLGTAFRA